MSSSQETSSVWYHFTKENKKGRCRYCKVILSMPGGSSTGNLRRHLKSKHPTVPFLREDSCSTVGRSRSPLVSTESEDRENSEGQAITSQIESSDLESYSDTLCSSPLIESSQSRSRSSLPLSLATSLNVSYTQYPICNPMNKFIDIVKPMPLNKSKSIDIQLLKMICKEYHPFSIVEDKEFKKFINLLCPSYSLPSRKTLSNSLLSSIHKEILDKIIINLVDSQAVCLTCDGWTNINNISFYAVTAHYIDLNTHLQSHLLECSEFNDRHTALNISQWIDTVIKKFQIDYKICAIVTDNAANIKSAVNILRLRHISCFAHSLNLVVQNAIEKNIKDLVEKTKTIVQYFKQSSFALAKLHEIQNQMNKENLKLKQDVPTRWNSTFDMLERFLLNKEPIISALALLGSKNTLQSEDWDLMEHCVNILRIFNEITKEVSSENNVSLSKISVLSRLMIRKVKIYLQNKELPLIIKNLGEELITGLSNRFEGREGNDLIAQSIFLDPRFKKQGFGDESNFQITYQRLVTKLKTYTNQESLQSVSQTVQSVSKSSSTSSVWTDFDDAINQLQGAYNPSAAAIVELDKYLAESYVTRTNDPLIWWKSRKILYPNLYKVMLKRLCIPATSVPCERIFSKAGQICNEKRSRLTTTKISQILFVNNNSDLI